MATLVQLAGVVMIGVLACAAFVTVAAYAEAAAYSRRHPVRCVADDDDVLPWPARALARTRLVVTEAAALAVGVLAWPLARHEVRPGTRASGEAHRPIVVVHGSGVYATGSRVLARRLRWDGWTQVYAVATTPRAGTLEQRAERLGEVIERIRVAAGAPHVDVVAYGMAGLVARAWVRGRGASAGVGRLVTLGTPHQGTHAPAWLGFDPRAEDIEAGSPFLVRLGGDDPVPTLADCTAIYSADDARLVPTTLAYWPGAFNVEVRGVGHMALPWSHRVYGLVRENLEAPPLAAADARR